MAPPQQNDIGPPPMLSSDDFKSLYKAGPNLALLTGWTFSIIGIFPCIVMRMLAGMSVSVARFGIYGLLFGSPAIISAIALAYDYNRRIPPKVKIRWLLPAILTAFELILVLGLV